jgi:hypothetical protein
MEASTSHNRLSLRDLLGLHHVPADLSCGKEFTVPMAQRLGLAHSPGVVVTPRIMPLAANAPQRSQSTCETQQSFHAAVGWNCETFSELIITLDWKRKYAKLLYRHVHFLCCTEEWGRYFSMCHDMNLRLEQRQAANVSN